MTILLWGGAAIVCVAAALFFGRHAGRRELEAKASGAYAKGFVFVNDDGTVRELLPNEIDYLNRNFDPADSGRPYIKSSYRSRTPDGRVSGFLPRSSVPMTATWRDDKHHV